MQRQTMKTSYLILPLIVILFLSTATAQEVSLDFILDVSDDVQTSSPTSFDIQAIEDEAICISYHWTATVNTRIHCWDYNGNELYDSGTLSPRVSYGLHSAYGYLVYSSQQADPGNYVVVDVSTPGFYTVKGSPVPGYPASGRVGRMAVMGRSAGELYLMGDISSTSPGGDSWHFFNISGGNQYGFTTWASRKWENWGLLDLENSVYAASNILYRFEVNASATLLYNSTSGDIAVFNENSNDPKYYTYTGKKIITNSAYNTFSETSTTGNTSITPIAYINDDLIIGYANGELYKIDFSDNVNPESYPLNVSWYGADSSSPRPPVQRADNYMIAYNSSEESFYFYLINVTEAGCELSGGCFLNDTFEYLDNVLNHGWQGSSLTPDDGTLFCDGSQYQQNYYYVVPVTKSTGTAVLDASINFCAGSGHEFYLAMGDEGLTGWTIQIQDDGDILDWQGEDIGNWNVTCDADNYHNLSAHIHFQNQPKSFDLYVDGVLQTANNPFTQHGQTFTELEWVLVASNIFPDYCNWTMDSISLTTLQSQLEDDLNLTEQFEIEAYTYGCWLFGGDNPGFDDSQCRPNEGYNWCVMRCTVSSLGSWLLDLILDNILVVLAFVVLIVFTAIIYEKFKR